MDARPRYSPLLGLCALLLGCGSTATSEPPLESPAAAIIDVPIPNGAVTSSRSVVLDADEASRIVGAAPLILDAYPKGLIAPIDMVRHRAEPVFRQGLGLSTDWPWERVLTLPADPELRFVAWMDLDDDGVISSGDRCSRPQKLGRSDTPLPLVIERIYVVAAVDAARRTRRVSFDGDPTIRARGTSGVLILGFLAEDLGPDGLPTQGARPEFDWSHRDRTVQWPLYLDAELPHGDDRLRYLPVLDDDANGRLSQGDRLGTPVAAPPNGAEIEFWIDQRLPVGGRPQGESHEPR